MSKKHFGTDGIRGHVGDAKINPEFMLKLGWAIGSTIFDQAHETVLIGRDTRISGSVLESALQAGLTAAGVNVLTLGVIPTPAVAYLTQTMRAGAGLVISASHNPFYDNGIKIFNAQGMKLTDEQEQAIETRLEQPMTMVDSEFLGEVQAFESDAQGRYIEFCKSVLPNHLSLKGMKLVVDCANGAGFHVAPIIFHELGAEIIKIGCTPDGLNINNECGAMHTQPLQQAVLDNQADLGIALDGDGDRLLLVDDQGELVDGDEILAVLARYGKTKGEAHVGVVGTVMSNLGLEQAVTNLQMQFLRASVGDRYVLEELLKNNWTLGGESSGHIVNLDYTTTGDGTMTAIQVLHILCLYKSTLHTLKGVMTKRPQILENIRFTGSRDILEHQDIQAAVRKVQTALADRGRVLLRLSGTEPLVRIMAEGNDEAQVRAAVTELVAAVTVIASS